MRKMSLILGTGVIVVLLTVVLVTTGIGVPVSAYDLGDMVVCGVPLHEGYTYIGVWSLDGELKGIVHTDNVAVWLTGGVQEIAGRQMVANEHGDWLPLDRVNWHQNPDLKEFVENSGYLNRKPQTDCP